MALSLAWFQSKGAPYDAMTDLDYAYREYLKSKSGITETDLSSHLRVVLSGLGYTQPSLQGALKEFYAAKTGLALTHGFLVLENAFYANTSLDFA